MLAWVKFGFWRWGNLQMEKYEIIKCVKLLMLKLKYSTCEYITKCDIVLFKLSFFLIKCVGLPFWNIPVHINPHLLGTKLMWFLHNSYYLPQNISFWSLSWVVLHIPCVKTSFHCLVLIMTGCCWETEHLTLCSSKKKKKFTNYFLIWSLVP